MGFALKMAGVAERRARRSRCGRAAEILHITELLGPQPQGAVGRPAPARGHRPRHRAQAQGLPVRRAAVQPGRRAAREDAHRAVAPAPGAGHDDDLRHPRPGRGDDAGRPHRRASRGPRRAGRRAAGAVQPAGQRVRRRLHRRAAHQPGRPRRRPPAPPPRTGRCGTRWPAGAGQRAARRACGPSTCAWRPPARASPASVELAEHLGDSSILHLRVDGVDRPAERQGRRRNTPVEAGQTVGLAPDAAWALAFDADGRLAA